MAFVSSGYNPEKPMEGRISDIGPRKYDSFFPEVIKKNFGGYLEVVKTSSNPSISEGNRCYSLEGAVFGVYNQEGSRVAQLTTGPDGKTARCYPQARTPFAKKRLLMALLPHLTQAWLLPRAAPPQQAFPMHRKTRLSTLSAKRSTQKPTPLTPSDRQP